MQSSDADPRLLWWSARARSRSSRPRRPRTCGSPTSRQTPASTSRSQLRHVEQVPGRDHGRRRGPARLRQRRPPGHVLHERREDRRPDADGQTARQVRCEVLEPPLSPEAGRHVRRRHREGRSHRHAAELLRHGRRGRRLRQRRLRRPLRHQLRRQHALSQQRQRHVHRRHRPRRRRLPAGGARAPGFFDYDNDGKLDLFVTRYVDWSFQTNRYCGEKKPGYRAYCHPDNYAGVDEHPVSQQRRRHVHRRLREGRHRAAPTARGSASRSPTTIATASWTSTSPTTRCSRFLYRNNRNGTFTEVGLLAGVGFNEDGKTFAGMGVDFADYDNDGQPDIVVTDLSERALHAVSPERRRQLSRRHQRVRRRGRHAAVFRLEHAVLRLRQRWLEGHLRRAGPRDGHDREDLAQPEISAAAAAAAQRVGAFRRESMPGDAFQQDWAGRGAAFGDLDNDGDIDVVVEQRRAEGRRAAERRRQPQTAGWRFGRSARRRIATGSAAG